MNRKRKTKFLPLKRYFKYNYNLNEYHWKLIPSKFKLWDNNSLKNRPTTKKYEKKDCNEISVDQCPINECSVLIDNNKTPVCAIKSDKMEYIEFICYLESRKIKKLLELLDDLMILEDNNFRCENEKLRNPNEILGLNTVLELHIVRKKV